jgi:AbiV family abortive infection protein
VTEAQNPEVSPQHLLHGAVYALEQCGVLLRDANVLYRSESYANAVVLARFAQEELGPLHKFGTNEGIRAGTVRSIGRLVGASR